MDFTRNIANNISTASIKIHMIPVCFELAELYHSLSLFTFCAAGVTETDRVFSIGSNELVPLAFNVTIAVFSEVVKFPFGVISM